MPSRVPQGVGVAVLVGIALLVGVVIGRAGGSSPEQIVVAAPAAPGTGGDTAAATPAPVRLPGLDEARPGFPVVDVDAVNRPPVLAKNTPPLVELDGWLQSDIDSLDDLDGRVKIVQFWTAGCFNCKETTPYLRAIYDEYHDDGLEIVGVHAPEFEWEKDVDRIQEAAVEHGIIWPIALDTDKLNFRAWQKPRAYWPRTLVLDERGRVRYNNIGEGSYDELAETVAWLLAR